MADETTPQVPTIYQAPGPVDPFLEPLVWSVAGDWPRELERMRRGEVPATTPLARAGLELSALHTEATRLAAQAPYDRLQPGPLVERFAQVWNTVLDSLGDQLKWLTGLRPDQTDFDTLNHADLVVQLGQVMRAVHFLALGRKLSDLDYLRGYTAQMRADWLPIAKHEPGHLLQSNLIAERYNWLLRRARFIVVKKSQHVDKLDEINLAEMPRSAAVLDFALTHLLRGVAFA